METVELWKRSPIRLFQIRGNKGRKRSFEDLLDEIFSLRFEEEKLRLEPLLVRYDEKKKDRERVGSFYARTNIFIIHPTVNRLPIFPRELINFPFLDDDLSFIVDDLSFEIEDPRCLPILLVRYPTMNFRCLERGTYLFFLFFFFEKIRRLKRIGISRIPAFVRS